MMVLAAADGVAMRSSSPSPGLVAFAAGAVQLLPSFEYSRHALRFVSGGAVPATERIPYRYLTNRFYANGIVNLLFAVSRAEAGYGETIIPYLGIFPLLLAAIGIWKAWACRWVRYLTGLAIAAFAYSLGPASLLHGVLYAITPYLWLAHEADRFVYLVDFALAILAAYGAQALFSPRDSVWAPLSKLLRWVAAAAIVGLAIPTLFSPPALSPWISLSLVLIVVSWLLYRYAASGHTGTLARVLTLALILFDIGAFDFTGLNRDEMSAKGANEMDRLLSCEGAAKFLSSQPGLFRTQVAFSPTPNIGDAFQVQAAGGSGVTLSREYAETSGRTDLLNVRYIVKPASVADAGTVYQDAAWKIYENPNAFPRAWLVHSSVVEPVPLELVKRLDDSKTDLHRVAVLTAPLDTSLDQVSDTATEQVNFISYAANAMDLSVHAGGGRSLLVLSEMYDPSWVATVNGKPARIWKVDGSLRGIIVPRGESHVSLRYRPMPIYIGAALTVAAFLAVLLALIWFRGAGTLPAAAS